MLLGGMSIISAVIAVVVCATGGSFQSLAWLWVLPVSFVAGFLGLFLLAFFFLWFCSLRVDIEKGSSESPFYRRVATIYIQAALTILGMRVHTKGLENTPQGRYLLVCNHLNDLDPITLLYFFKKSNLAFITKWENQRLFIVGKLMYKLRCQPINRENDREALKTILNCIKLIKEDIANVAVFPEGYTSMDHKLHQFRPGVFKIAQKTGAPIAVCTLTNTHKVFHNALRLKPTDVDLHLVRVIQPEEYQGITTVELAQRIHAIMAEDLGPEYAENT
jgi:1-acyl-sn-glycerol-3-phosphate acyltransferase